LKIALQKKDHPHHRAINEERSNSLVPSFSLFNSYEKILMSSIKQNGEECWVRFGSSTWNVFWHWNNNERRLRLPKITKEIKLEVLTSWRRAERSGTLKQQTKTLTLLEHYHVHLF